MFTPASLLLTLSLSYLSAALPTIVPKETTCTPPTSFTVSRFSTFTPSGDNTTPAQITFSYSDNTGAVPQTTCLLKGSTETTSDVPVPCANPDVSFLYKENELTVFETFPACNSTEKTLVQGTIYVGTYCYPSPAGVPLGVGTSCQTPSVSLGGSLA